MSLHAIPSLPPEAVEPPADQSGDQRPAFADFWALYPRRVAKQAAARAWARLSDTDQIEALVGLVAWAVVWRHQAQQREEWLDFLPHPASWLNGRRWEDELPARFRPMVDPKPVSQVVSQLCTPRVEMPEHVRAAIAKLRAKA